MIICVLSTILIYIYTLYVYIDDDLIDIAAYGHYIDVAPSHEIETFIQQLPDWSKGAEWTKFPSYLIKDTI